MPIDFTLTPEQQRLRADARAFARDVLSKVGSATKDLPTPLARFAATRPFYEQTIAAGFLRRLIPIPLGGQGTGVVDMAVLAEEFHAIHVNISLTLLGTMLGLFPVLLAGTSEQAARFFAPFAAQQGAPLAAFAFSEPGGSANFAAPAPAEGVRTQARLEGDHWVISGAKKWVSSGGEGADLLTVGLPHRSRCTTRERDLGYRRPRAGGGHRTGSCDRFHRSPRASATTVPADRRTHARR